MVVRYLSIITGFMFILFMSTVSNSKSEFNVKDYGAKGDGQSLDTQAIQKAIDDASKNGGGKLYFPPGIYLSGTIYLKNNVTLCLEKDSKILGSTTLEDYPENASPVPSKGIEFGRYSLIYGRDLENVSILGEGIIDGQGMADSFNEEKNLAKGWSHRDVYLKRPYLMCFVECKHVQVRNITLMNSAFWVQDYLVCEDVLLEGITVHSWKINFNNDGIDIDGSRNVRVSNCNIRSGDDGLCLKATYRDCENITIRNCIVSSLCNGIKFGTATNAGFKNISVSNCTVYETGLAGLALEIVDGGTMDSIAVSNITMRDVGTPIFLRLGNCARRWRDDIPKPEIGKFRNASIDNIVATSTAEEKKNGPFCSSIAGLPGHPIQNVSLSNIKIMYLYGSSKEQSKIALKDVPEKPSDYPEYHMLGPLPAYGFYCRHVDGLTLSNVDVRYEKPDYRSALVCDDVQHLEIHGFKGQSLPESQPFMVFNDVADARIQNCQAPVDTPVFLHLQGEPKRITATGNNLSEAKIPFEFEAPASPSILYQSSNRMQDSH